MWFLSPRPHPVPVFPEGWQLPLLPMNFGCKSEAVTLVLHLHNSLAHFQNETFITKVTRMEVHFRVKLAADTVFRAALFFFFFYQFLLEIWPGKLKCQYQDCLMLWRIFWKHYRTKQASPCGKFAVKTQTPPQMCSDSLVGHLNKPVQYEATAASAPNRKDATTLHRI